LSLRHAIRIAKWRLARGAKRFSVCI
jgi:hypothetical protein